MCVQCAAGAMTAGTAALGARHVLLARLRAPRARRVVTGVLLVAGVLGAGLVGGPA
jgi:hypothetical protein